MEGAIAGSADDGEELARLHPNHIKVLRVQALLLALPLVIAALMLELASFLPLGVLTIPALIFAGFIVLRMPMRRYHARGYALSADRLRVVRGLLFRTDTVVPFGRIQHIDVHQGPLERAYGLGMLTVHTAGTHNASVSLPGLAYTDAAAMREMIRAHIKRETA